MNSEPTQTNRRNFIRLAGGGVLLAATAGCSRALPPAALQAWKGPAASESDVRRWALGFAILAPHSHNLQSWVVDLRSPGELVLTCDRNRLLPETDPLSRQIMVSHGTFLELLDIAARERGHRTEVTLFPQGVFSATGVDARAVARVRFLPDATVQRDPLFAQVLRRRTNREAYEARSPEPAALAAIVAAASAEGLRPAFPGMIAAQRAIASEAWRIELTTPRTIMESYRLLRVGPDEIARHRDGLSINQPMLRALSAVGLLDRSRPPAADAYATTSQLEQFDRKLAATPAFFSLVSDGNDRITQVRAGRAYVRAQLAATAYGLSMHPLSQALQEYPEQAGPYARIHKLLGAQAGHEVAQMWTRLGYGPAIEPSPRRGADEHIAQGAAA